ncbi:MAG: hypothetical protein PHP10_00530 [Candidatus Omnitrophica bacterium]|nr:hypothetical protein [Candidatus Omnitrophota bacterium]
MINSPATLKRWIMVEDKLRQISSYLKLKGCFFCLAVFAFFISFLTSPAFARQSLEYNAVTGLWGYSEKDAAFSPSSRQALEYNTVTGLWDYSARGTASSFSAHQTSCIITFNLL